MLDTKKKFIKSILLGIFFFISACNSDENADFKWDIVNNSSDTIFITQATYPLNDSIVIPPHETFTEIDSDFGKGQTFYCARNFPEGEVTVAVSGGKKLLKDLYDNENWVQLSEYTKHGGKHNCSFIIEQVDIE